MCFLRQRHQISVPASVTQSECSRRCHPIREFPPVSPNQSVPVDVTQSENSRQCHQISVSARLLKEFHVRPTQIYHFSPILISCTCPFNSLVTSHSCMREFQACVNKLNIAKALFNASAHKLVWKTFLLDLLIFTSWRIYKLHEKYFHRTCWWLPLFLSTVCSGEHMGLYSDFELSCIFLFVAHKKYVDIQEQASNIYDFRSVNTLYWAYAVCSVAVPLLAILRLFWTVPCKTTTFAKYCSLRPCSVKITVVHSNPCEWKVCEITLLYKIHLAMLQSGYSV